MSDEEDVLVPQQAEVKMYLNPMNDVVIARAPSEYDRVRLGSKAEDVHIVIPRHYVPAMIERLKLLLVEAN